MLVTICCVKHTFLQETQRPGRILSEAFGEHDSLANPLKERLAPTTKPLKSRLSAPNRCPPFHARLRWSLSLGRVVPCPQRSRCSRRAWNTRRPDIEKLRLHSEIRFAQGPRSRSRAEQFK